MPTEASHQSSTKTISLQLCGNLWRCAVAIARCVRICCSMKRQAAEALLRGGAEGVRDWNAQRMKTAPEDMPRLEGVELPGAQLSGVELASVEMDGAKLAGADLTGADLMRVVLRGADLAGAGLEGADLREANLGGSELKGATLARADLRYAILTGAGLSGADLSGANLQFVRGLTQEQVDAAAGDAATRLPGTLQRPPAWA